MGFATKKERKSTCPNALEFAMTTLMSHNNDQDSIKIFEAQPKKMVANETMYYVAVTIQSRKKQNTNILHSREALNG